MQVSIEKQIVQREHARLQVDCVACAKLSKSKFGIITMISREGLVFRYIQENFEDKNDSKELLEVSIVVNNHGFALHNVPCRIIKDHDYYISSAKMQKCHIQFGELTEDQKVQLDYFITHYTNIGN